MSDESDRERETTDAPERGTVRAIETTAGGWLAVHGPSGATATGDTEAAARDALTEALALRGGSDADPPAERWRIGRDGE